MAKQLGLGFFFVLCLCLALIINMPVVHLLAQIKLPNNLLLSGIKGTLFNGHIDSLVVDKIQVDDLGYDFSPGCLLSLKICYDIEADLGKGKIQADPIDQSIDLNSFEINYPLENLAAFSDRLLVRPSGNLQILIDTLTLRQQQVGQVNGRIQWQQAGIVGEAIELGDYELTVSQATQGYQFELKDLKALLTVDGKGQLKADGQYSMDINIQSQPGLNQSIKSALEFVAKKKGLNRYDIRRSGKLPNQALKHLSF